MKIVHIAAMLLLPIIPVAPSRAATPQDVRSKIVRTPLLRGDLKSEKRVHSVVATRVDFSPGQRSGRHQHPVPTMGIVLSGRILFQIEGQPAREIASGEAFFEPPDTTVVRFDNASSTEPASFAGFYLLGERETAIISAAPEPAAGAGHDR